jgi:hypothetical protein
MFWLAPALDSPFNRDANAQARMVVHRHVPGGRQTPARARFAKAVQHWQAGKQAQRLL